MSFVLSVISATPKKTTMKTSAAKGSTTR